MLENTDKTNQKNQKIDTSPSFMDRNLLYHIDKINYKDDPSLGVQFILFIHHLAQSRQGTLFFLNDYLMFTASEFAQFTGKTKADILRKVPNWSHKVFIPGQGDVEVSTRLDKLLYHYAHNPLDLKEIYRFKSKYNESFKEDADYIFATGKSPTLIDNYIYDVSNHKSRERVYGVLPNILCLNSIITESSTFYTADAPLLNGKGIHPHLFLALLRNKSNADSNQRASFKIHIHQLLEYAKINVEGYSPAKNLSRSKARLNKILDMFFEKSLALKLKYKQDHQNCYVFTSTHITTLIPQGKKLAMLTHNILNRTFLEFLSKLDTPTTEYLTDEERKDLLYKMVHTYDFNKRDPAYQDMFIKTIQKFAKFENHTIKKALDEHYAPLRDKFFAAQKKI